MTDLIKHDESPSLTTLEEVALANSVAGAASVATGEPADAQSSVSRGRSPSRLLWLKLRRDRTGMAGLYTLAVLYAGAILAGFIAPYKYDDARHDLPFYPPMIARVHIFDEQGRLSRPFVYGIVPVDRQLATYRD